MTILKKMFQKKSGIKREVVFGEWFIHMTASEEIFPKKWYQKRGGPWSVVHTHDSIKGNVSEKIGIKRRMVFR